MFEERVDNWLFITLVPMFYNETFLFDGFTTLGTYFDWLVHLVQYPNV